MYETILRISSCVGHAEKKDQHTLALCRSGWPQNLLFIFPSENTIVSLGLASDHARSRFGDGEAGSPDITSENSVNTFELMILSCRMIRSTVVELRLLPQIVYLLVL
jgi:hypothetical protein